MSTDNFTCVNMLKLIYSDTSLLLFALSVGQELSYLAKTVTGAEGFICLDSACTVGDLLW